MKLTTMDKQSCKTLATRMAELLKPLEAEFGVKVKLGGGKYSAGSYAPKVEVAVIDENGQAETPERESFRLCAVSFDLLPTDLDTTFVAAGKTYRISGLKPASYVRPILATDVRGKTFKFPADVVRNALGRPRPVRSFNVGGVELTEGVA